MKYYIQNYKKIKIFGKLFVKNNTKKCRIIRNNKEKELKEYEKKNKKELKEYFKKKVFKYEIRN